MWVAIYSPRLYISVSSILDEIQAKFLTWTDVKTVNYSLLGSYFGGDRPIIYNKKPLLAKPKEAYHFCKFVTTEMDKNDLNLKH